MGLFQEPEPTQIKKKLAPFSHPTPIRQYPEPDGERNTSGCQAVLEGEPARGSQKPDGEVGWTDGPHTQPRSALGGVTMHSEAKYSLPNSPLSASDSALLK